MQRKVQKKRALVSVSEKTGLEALGNGLVALGFEIVSTGSTGAALESFGLEVTKVESLTGYPEILGGRVKTLHPAIFGGMLARVDLDSDVRDLEAHDIGAIAVVVCNLYPFEEAVREKASSDELIENIDIGGVTLLRAAAKNYAHVLVLCDPSDYEAALGSLRDGSLGESQRRHFALKAFARTAAYDSCIFSTLSVRWDKPAPTAAGPLGSGTENLELTRVQELRYGENPHQRATLYRQKSPVGGAGGGPVGCDLSSVKQLAGKELSYNNYLDTEHGLRLLVDLPSSSCLILKHNTPCGVGLASSGLTGDQASAEAFARAFEADKISPFGGVVLFGQEVGAQAARQLSEIFLEVVTAPSFSPEALEILGTKKNLRLLILDPSQGLSMREQWTPIQGGFLKQDVDASPDCLRGEPWSWDASFWQKLGEGQSAELDANWKQALQLGWVCVKHVRSNAIVLARPGQTLAIAGGFTNRVDAVRRCLDLYSSYVATGDKVPFVLASDGFFPFADSIEILKGLPVRAIIQPGGSVRDHEVLEAARQMNIPMYLTGVRHFKH